MRFIGKAFVLLLVLFVMASFRSEIDPPKKPVKDPYDMAAYVPFSDTSAFQIDSFFRRMYRWGIFNGSYLFHKNDSVCYGAMGYATFSQLDSLKPADLFQLASVSKTFTGMAMMMLAPFIPLWFSSSTLAKPSASHPNTLSNARRALIFLAPASSSTTDHSR